MGHLERTGEIHLLLYSLTFMMTFGTGLTSWIFDGNDLGGFAGVSDAGLVLGTDLELNLCPFNDVGHSVLTVRTRGLCTLHPASSKFLLLFNAIPAE